MKTWKPMKVTAVGQVTEVVNYIRSAWGNNARAVTIDDVRDQHGLMLH